MPQPISTSRLANYGAAGIYRAFEQYYGRFREITCRARGRFERREWLEARQDAAERLDFYREAVDAAVAEVRELLGERAGERLAWASMKAVYSGLIARCHQWELAETFFNSVTRRIFATVGVDRDIEFVDSDFDTPPTESQERVSHSYPVRAPVSRPPVAGLLAAILAGAPLSARFENLDRDTRLGAARIEQHIQGLDAGPVRRAEVITAIFYRGNAAYLVGRLFCERAVLPLVLSLRHHGGGVILDAVLLNENDVSILFSFAHSYFQVDVERPWDLVRHIKLILPRKRIAELYISIGFNKQGKTELYRDLLHHLDHTTDRFDLAPGERGMVMAVFTMPSYDVVFKIIKDHFARPKSTTRRAVMGKYHLVYKHDRAGRLVDAQEFEHLRFPRALFTDRLVEHLLRDAAHTVSLEGDAVHIRHAYVQRRVTPLNLYIREAGDAAAAAAVIDYGRCIKDLMDVNIFPGDLLLKNFGVTSNGRVVFYDYDELAEVTDCNFRELPAGRSDDEDFAEHPWRAIGENDVFPAEWARFLGLSGPLREVFLSHHADLFEAATWRSLKERHLAGELVFIIPYGQSKRLRPEAPIA